VIAANPSANASTIPIESSLDRRRNSRQRLLCMPWDLKDRANGYPWIWKMEQ